MSEVHGTPFYYLDYPQSAGLLDEIAAGAERAKEVAILVHPDGEIVHITAPSTDKIRAMIRRWRMKKTETELRALEHSGATSGVLSVSLTADGVMRLPVWWEGFLRRLSDPMDDEGEFSAELLRRLPNYARCAMEDWLAGVGADPTDT